MAQLFDYNPDNISLHLKNIYKEKELEEVATAEDFSVVQKEGTQEDSSSRSDSLRSWKMSNMESNMITPDQFYVNEAWIAVRINEEFIFVQDEPYDIYILMDAASCFVLGHVLSRVIDEAPQEKDIKELFQAAFQSKNQWAKVLILTGNSPADDAFRNQAVQEGLSIQTVKLSDLEPIIGPLKASLALTMKQKST